MKYLLDTDHISILQHPQSAEYVILAIRLDQHPKTDFAVSIASLHEQVIGCHAFLNKARKPEEIIRGYELLGATQRGYSKITILPYDASVAAVDDGLSGMRIATMDRRIAATALAHGLTLLSRNRSDFAGIPGLVVEDWTV